MDDTVLKLLEELEQVVDEGRSSPFSNKVQVDKDEIFEIIDEIKKINPDAIIYVESILPVSEKVSMNHSYIKKAKIDEYNVLIKEMVKEKGVYYLDISSAVANEAGYLPEDAATDGIHLNKKYCDKWLQYLKTHYIVEN